MLNIGVIGLGNAGNQVAALANEELKVPSMAINSSEKDLETIPNSIPRKLIQDATGSSKGAGKDRSLAKKYMKDSVITLISDPEFEKFMNDIDVCFVVSSTGGGTGSGVAPVFTKVLRKAFSDTKVILIGILPVDSEALSAHVNTLEYLNEIYNSLNDQTYMLYDNDKYSGLSSYQIMNNVNAEIVKDLNVLRCTYNYTTKFSSIDDKDMSRLISFPGRIMLARLENFKDKDTDTTTIEDMIIDTIKRNAHAEAQRDKAVMASGIITNMSQTLTDEFDDNIPKVRDFTGEPVHAFSHIYVNEDRKDSNNVFLIMSGLTPANDKIFKIEERIKEIEERQKVLEEESALSSVNMNELSNKIKDKQVDDKESEVDIKSIFADFDA